MIMEKRIIRRFLKLFGREERRMKPILLKCGLALALTFAGFLYSHLRTKRIKPSATPPRGHPSGHGNEGGGIRAACSCSNLSEEETCIKKVVGNSPPDLSPRTKQSGEEDEFNDIMKDAEFGVTGNSFKKEVETPRLKVGSPVAYLSLQKDAYEQEIWQLRNMIRMLQERERNLEVQLLEYCGLKEQETVVMELQNRLKISNMEAKMFNLKVETLQSENRRLAEQVADHAKVLAELDAAKTKVKFLKRKIRYEAEQNKEQIINLKQRVSKLQDLENQAAASDQEIQTKLRRLKDLEAEAEQLRKTNLRLQVDNSDLARRLDSTQNQAASDQEIQTKLRRLKDLEAEAEQLRKTNFRLQVDNSDLARRLDSTQILANAVLEDPEADALREEGERLRQENEGLAKEVEKLQADRCSDVEELVYLRWINACLRHEMRNYQPPPGKTVARDLSKSLSPTSEKKAKQLIVEYANNTEGGRGSISDFDSDQWSSSQASFHTDSGECDDYSPLENSSDARANNTTSKSKIFSKLMRLLQGKDSHHNRSRVTSHEKYGPQDDSNIPHFRLSMSTGNDTSGAEGRRRSIEFTTPSGISRTSLDLSRTVSLKDETRRNSDASSKNFSPMRRGSLDLKSSLNSLSESTRSEKSSLVKYAEALKDSSETPKLKIERRTASFSSF